MTVLAADWGAPPGVRVFTTTRTGGTSLAPYDSLNLAAHVGDSPETVQRNRRILGQSQGWDTEPLWLDQVQGTTVIRAEDLLTSAGGPAAAPQADGVVTMRRELPLVVLTADCLPVAACDKAGTVIGLFHAGWKGLLAGILEEGLHALERPPEEILVWIGPAIGGESYQVGPEVREAYLAADPAHEADFAADGPGHWKFDLAGAAVRRFASAGVGSVTRNRWDTFRDTDLFFSHRRHAPCGRVGTFMILEKGGSS